MDFDAFLVELALKQAELCPDLFITKGGFRAGSIPLEPIETLEERCRAKWRGRVTLTLRAKQRADGHIAFAGSLPLDDEGAAPATPAAAAPTTTQDAAVAALVQQMQSMQSQIRDLLVLRGGAPSPALNDQVGALGGLVDVFKGIAGVAGGGMNAAKAIAGTSPEDLLKFVDIGKALAGNADNSVLMKAIDMFGPAGVETLKTAAALMMVKITEATTKETPPPAPAPAKEGEP